MGRMLMLWIYVACQMIVFALSDYAFSSVKDIRVGMTAAQAVKVAGNPDARAPFIMGSQIWKYGQMAVVIYQGKVSSIKSGKALMRDLADIERETKNMDRAYEDLKKLTK